MSIVKPTLVKFRGLHDRKVESILITLLCKVAELKIISVYFAPFSVMTKVILLENPSTPEIFTCLHGSRLFKICMKAYMINIPVVFSFLESLELANSFRDSMYGGPSLSFWYLYIKASFDSNLKVKISCILKMKSFLIWIWK